MPAAPLRVQFRAQYLSRPVDGMRGADHDATLLVKAVKGLDISAKQYTWVIIGGVNVKITDETKDRSIEWFAEWASAKIDAITVRPKVIIPVPSSSTVATSAPTYRTALIADAIAARCKRAVAAPVLRFQNAGASSRSGDGTRDKNQIYNNLMLNGPIPTGSVFLVDDVFTTGAHLIASAWQLIDQGRAPSAAICCGRSLHAKLQEPLSVDDVDLDISR